MNNSSVKIAVGSKNPVKLAAVKTAVSRYWPNAAVIEIRVPSGVSDMPMSDAECIDGAKMRAQLARQQAAADFGVGLEAGVHEIEGELFLGGWVAVTNENAQISLAPTAKLMLPSAIAQRVRHGEELGPVMDELTAVQNTKQKGGAIGILTNGVILRKDSFVTAVAFAFAPFVSPFY